MKLPSSKTLFVETLKVHQAVYEGTRGLVGHRVLLGMPALSPYQKMTERSLPVVVLARR